MDIYNHLTIRNMIYIDEYIVCLILIWGLWRVCYTIYITVSIYFDKLNSNKNIHSVGNDNISLSTLLHDLYDS